uniref:PB1-like domain-containing protein n=1 Tax=Lactuca sativa TaxID=4236 RepID=A0A9R1UWG4_LACSA|nr:hypothetical protein LSAT_V11C700386280 [Lactuca sativa]
MGPTLWSMRPRNSPTDVDKLRFAPYFHNACFTWGMFSKSPGRRYVLGKVNYVDFIDIDKFSVHELDVIFEELGYGRQDCIYYQYCIPGIDLDYGLLPLGNDQDVIRLSTYVGKNKEIRFYSEHGL